MTIANGGTVNSYISFIGQDYNNPNVNSNAYGNVTVTDPGTLWNSGLLRIGTGIMTIANGAEVEDTEGDVANSYASDTNSTVLVTGSNSVWLTTGQLGLGLYGRSNITVQNGGTIVVDGEMVYGNFNAPRTSVFNLETGGVLQLGGNINALDPNFNLNWAGGTLQIIGSGTYSYTNSVLAANTTSTLDTNGNDTIWYNGISGNGNFVKTGAGTLTLNGTNTYTGNTTISAGTLLLGNSLGLQDSTLLYNTGGGTLSFGSLTSATLGGLSGNQNLALTNNASSGVSLTVGGNGQSTTYSGNFSGNGSLTVTGTNSLTLTGNSSYAGITLVNNGTLNVTTGGNIATSNTSVGDATGSNGSLIVSSSTFLATGNLNVGNLGLGNLAISNGGNVVSGNGIVGSQSGSSGSVLVTDTHSSWNLGTNLLELGNYNSGGTSAGGIGNLTIANGGSVLAGAIAVGSGGVLGANGTIAGAGTGYLTIASGGSLTSEAGFITVGPDSIGSGLVTGTNSTWNLDTGGTYAALEVGHSGTGILTVANGGKINSAQGFVGNDEGNGSMLVTGANSTWNASGNLDVGISGTGNLAIANGGEVISATGNIGVNVNGNNNSTGTVTVDGASSTWLMGSGLGSLFVGYSGPGSLTISNGGNVTGGMVVVGNFGVQIISHQGTTNASNGTVLVTDTNSTLNATNALYVGNLGIGSLTVANGGLINANDGMILAAQAGSSGTANLNDGTLSVGGTNGINAGSGSYAFNFGGGVLQVSGSDLTTTINATLMNSTTSTINTNSLNATWSGVLSGSGNLTKIGQGTLTINATNTFTGNTTITAGTLAGNGTVGLGNATINGTLLPGTLGTAGLLSFGSNLTLTANAAADFQLGGVVQGAQYSAVNIAGSLSLGGTLMVNLLNNFAPSYGSSFDLFQAVNIAGVFASVILPTLNANLSWDTSQLDIDGDITTDAIDFTQWANEAGLSGASALPSAKPFTGGPANLIRYAMNLGTAVAPANLPQPTLTSISGTPYLSIQYRVRKNMTDYTLVPQYSTDLVNWTNVDAGNITQLTDADTYTAQYQAAVPFPTSGTIFLRVVAQ